MSRLIKTPAEIETMRESGQILAQTLTLLQEKITAGMTTKALDDLAVNETKKLGGTPAFLGYKGFPTGLCVSINDEIVHGIPSQRVIQKGDIVGLDYGVCCRGLITDAAVTVAIGRVSPQVATMLQVLEATLYQAISIVKSGLKTGDLGALIERQLTKAGLKVIYDLSGHGVGRSVHEEPTILNYGHPGHGRVLKAGMTIAIEPIASLSDHKLKLAADSWTCLTTDGSWAAQFEHTVLVTETGYEILTQL